MLGLAHNDAKQFDHLQLFIYRISMRFKPYLVAVASLLWAILVFIAAYYLWMNVHWMIGPGGSDSTAELIRDDQIIVKYSAWVAVFVGFLSLTNILLKRYWLLAVAFAASILCLGIGLIYYQWAYQQVVAASTGG